MTTQELTNPNWQPPFRHGLIILNLTMHADEATPGIHLTCIPYSRDCKRGPAVQASLGRALTGMGYPSTWKDVLDENGERVPNEIGIMKSSITKMVLYAISRSLTSKVL